MNVKVIKKIAISIVLSSVFACTSATMSECETIKLQELKNLIAQLQAKSNEQAMLESLEKRTKEAIKTIAKIREERSSPPREAGMMIAGTASNIFQSFVRVREKIGLEKIKQRHDLRAILESFFGLPLDRI